MTTSKQTEGDTDMTYDIARRAAEADAWDRLAAAIEDGDKVSAREAIVLLRKARSYGR